MASDIGKDNYSLSSVDINNSLAIVGRIVRLIASIVILCIGIYFSSKVFHLVYDNMHSPEAFRKTFADWVKAIEREEFNVKILGEDYKLAPYFVFGFLVMGILLLAHIAVHIMVARARVIAISHGSENQVTAILPERFSNHRGNRPRRESFDCLRRLAQSGVGAERLPL